MLKLSKRDILVHIEQFGDSSAFSHSYVRVRYALTCCSPLLKGEERPRQACEGGPTL